MRKLLYVVLLFVLVSLAACSQATPEPTAVPTAVPTVAPTQGSNNPAQTTGTEDCRPFQLLPDPKDPLTVSVPNVGKDDWALGPAKARMVIVEYSDFQCPYCAQTAPDLLKFQSEHPQDVLLVYRHFPLTSIHDKANLSAQASEAAGLQGKFWEMKDLLFNYENWQTWTKLSVADFENWLKTNAASIKGLDVDHFMKDLKSDAIVAKVQKAGTDAQTIGLGGTPTIFVFLDGQLVFDQNDQIPASYQVMDIIWQLHLLKARTYDTCPQMTIDPTKKYQATLETEKGKIVIDLLADKAPVTVNSFIFLAKEGWFDGVIFHRVLPDFVAQTGDPTGTGVGGPGYAIKDEISDLKFDGEGWVGMANSGANTNGSQFFITLAAQPNLDGRYTIFGRVVEGMDVVKSLTQRDPSQGGDLPAGDKILRVTISEKK